MAPDPPLLSHSNCSKGKWLCQDSAHCSSTCVLYGEGHVVTFDGQRFLFDGTCEYILVTVAAGDGGSRPGHTGGHCQQGQPARAHGGSLPTGAAAWAHGGVTAVAAKGPGTWKVTAVAPAQRPLPLGWLRRQHPAHLQDSDRKCCVRQVRRHLLPRHQDLPGGEPCLRTALPCPSPAACGMGGRCCEEASMSQSWPTPQQVPAW